jgi:hypothetical protein
MSNKQKAKGTRFENVVKGYFIDLFDHIVSVDRTQPGHPADIIVRTKNSAFPIHVQCKKRAHGFRQIQKWLENNHMLVVGADRQPPLLICRLDDFKSLAKELLHDMVSR